MKFLAILFFISVFLFVSCNRSSEKEEASSDSSALVSDSLAKDSSASRSAPGAEPAPGVSATVYEGILPCADCEGIRTSLKLSSNFKYSISQTYTGKSSRAVTSNGFYNEQRAYLGGPESVLLSLTDSKTGYQRYFIKYKEMELLLLDSKKKIVGGDNPYKLERK